MTLLKLKPRAWNNYDWIKYKHCIEVLKDPDGNPPPQTEGRTKRENWEIEWRENLDSYVARVKKELAK